MQIGFAKCVFPKRGALVLGVLENRRMLPKTRMINKESGGLLETAMKGSNFTGKSHEILTVYSLSGRIVLYGLGTGDEINKLWCETAGGRILSNLNKSGETGATVIFEEHPKAQGDIHERAAHFAYGALLNSYKFDKYKTKNKASDSSTLKKLTIAVDAHSVARKHFSELQAVADGVFFARDLVSEPPNILFPDSFSKKLQSLRTVGLKVEVLGEKEMSKLGMGALLGVGQGSSRESKLVIMRWTGGRRGEKPLGFIGKGVCFDTGGISLKPASGMEDMKWDMGGAAVVSGLMKALAVRKAGVNVVGIVGLVENMPDGNAQRPGDIVKSMSGQTIEIINTDAEGRLVLADALWYMNKRFKPKFMIDLATLTGAMMVALGQINCGYFSNDDTLAEQMEKAAKAVGEGLWRMPLGAEYNKMMDSDVADMKNAGPRFGGSVTAACFLERFVESCPWSHLDIAGMAWSAKDAPTVPKGGTGWGVRTLNELVKSNYEGV
ncbi:MAG: leucyl aminopeptidase [Rhodospirillaceae bacterium]|nr:leucyl aminopeptidase [Rhodospirillaceae bacterium]|tara:strand:+ start:1284 stop:2765 length:1482 start_codon:yes stop_codon:yes gene_type:complete